MNDERTESPESLEQAMAQMQPAPVHYHFAYSALPSKLFQGRAASVLLLQYWRSLEKYFRNLWESMAEQVNPESSRLAQLLSVTAYRIGGKHVVILVKMPPATRVVETHFVALVFRPELRYFTLGNSPAIICDDTPETTFREVTSDGANCNLGMGPEPTAKAFLLHICRYLDVEPTVEEIGEPEVHKFANQVPPCGPSVFDSAAGLSILQGFVAKTECEQRTAGVSEKLASLFAQLGSRNSSGPPQQIMARDLPLEEIDVILGSLFSDWAAAKSLSRQSSTQSKSKFVSAVALEGMRKQKARLALQTCFAVVLLSVSVFGILSLHDRFVAGTKSLDWPRTRGVMKMAIAESATETASRWDTTYYSPIVRYKYTVNGSSYTGNRYSNPPKRSQNPNSIQRLVSGFPPGMKVDVFYNPDNAAESVLIRGSGISTRSLYLLAYLTAFLALGWLAACAVRLRRITS